MHKDFIDYVNWPSRIVCTIPEGKEGLVEATWAANPSKLIYISRDRFYTNLTHKERAQMENCPTCPTKCPLTDIEGEIDENFEALERHEDKVLRRNLVNFVINHYLGPLLPYSNQTLQFFFTRDLDIQRIIKAANHAMAHNKSLEECYLYLKPVLIQTEAKITADVIEMEGETFRDYAKAQTSQQFASYMLKNNLIDITGLDTEPDDNRILLTRCAIVISKTFD